LVPFETEVAGVHPVAVMVEVPLYVRIATRRLPVAVDADHDGVAVVTNPDTLFVVVLPVAPMPTAARAVPPAESSKTRATSGTTPHSRDRPILRDLGIVFPLPP
jgi:hypothetical protein